MRELTEVLLEKENPFEKEVCTSTDEDPLPGPSSHDFKEPQIRGRTQHREPRGHRDSMTPERDISCASTHTVSSNKKKKTLKETMAHGKKQVTTCGGKNSRPCVKDNKDDPGNSLLSKGEP